MSHLLDKGKLAHFERRWEGFGAVVRALAAAVLASVSCVATSMDT